MTARQKIFTHMLRDRSGHYYYAKEFMHPTMDFSHQCYVGYEATARLSEITQELPDVFERIKDGRFKAQRINFHTSHLWLKELPEDLYQIALRELKPAAPPVDPVQEVLF